jgi:flagellar hook-associated protein 2
MGTVGLSFGSPTSGAGFDVATTVQQIVSNLQNVETPWKNQLTGLKSQDTALSSLGTLLSTVSTDLGNLTDFTGVLAQKTGSSSDTNVVQLTNASSSATAGTHTITVSSLATTSNGYLAEVTNASDQLSGSISIQVGTGKAHAVSVSSSSDTLAGLQAAINAAGIGVTASVLTDSTGSRLSIVSETSGGNGNLSVTSSITDTSNSHAQLTYNPVTKGVDASLNVDGVDLHSGSNTVTNLIPGVTFQLLAPSAAGSDGKTLEPVQVIIGNDNNGVETAINQFVTDYNALIAGINTQEGKDSSGNPEPLFGSPTLSLLQQQLMTLANAQNPNGYIDPVTTGSTLSGSMSLAVGGGVTDTIVIGAGTNTANTFYTGAGVNTLQGIVDALNAANSGTTLGFTSTAGNTGGTLPAVVTGNALSGSMTLTLGDGTTENVVVGDQPTNGPAANTIYTGSANPTLSQLEATINGTSAFGVTANITTDSTGLQTLSLASTDGSSSLSVDSSIVAAGPGVTANIVTSNGRSTLTLQSQTAGSAGALDVQSSLVAASGSTNTSLNYNSSSDLSTLANLGITASTKDDGTLTFDQSTLDAALNSDFSGALGFFQNANSWGQTVAAILNNMGTSSTNGILSLAEKSNSNIETTLNADVSKEDASIATQQKNLTTELNQANEILQQIPTELQGVNELYSAISGYNQNSNGG